MININNKEWINNGIKEIGFKELTEIQKKTIPLLLKNENLVGVSPTGTGKTYCFLFPILNKIDLDSSEIQTVIISPTRELARQIYSKFTHFTKFNKKLKVQLVIGGIEFDKVHEKVLKAKPQVIIATPERFLDLCETSIKTIFINTIVFDEADMTMELGFSSVFQKIFSVLSPNKNLQKIAFSATLHDMLSRQLSVYFKDTKIVDISENIWKNEQIKHILIHDQMNIAKEETLKTLITNINPYFCIIFCNTIDSANKIYELMKTMNINVGILHGKLESRKRKNVYKDIQNFKYQYLVATDLASRGLDIDGASHIISFELPKDDLWYIHRSGRSGRGKYHGESYVLFDTSYTLNVNRLRSKGIKWESLKIKKGKLESFEYLFKKPRKRKETEVDKKIQHAINISSKKVKPGYKKKLKEEIKKIKQKEKRKRIDQSVKKILVVKYKKENAAKTKIKQEQASKREKAETRKRY